MKTDPPNVGRRTATFTCRKTFIDANPYFSLITGYSRKELKKLSLRDIFGGPETEPALDSAEMSLSSGKAGRAGDRAVLSVNGGDKVPGLLNLEWEGDGKSAIYGSFVPESPEEPLEKYGFIGHFFSAGSLFASVEFGEDFNIIHSDPGFKALLNSKNGGEKAEEEKRKDLLQVFQKLKNSQGCVSLLLNGKEFVAVTTKNRGNTFARIYGKDYLINSYFPYALSVAQVRDIMWDNFPVMFFIDPERQIIVEANKAAASFYGYAIEEFSGMPVSNINVLPPEVLSQELELASAGKKRFIISRHRTADGRIKDINENVAPVVLCGRPYLFVFVTDITRRKNLEKVIEDKNLALSELNTGLSKLIQGEIDERRRKEQLFIQQSKLIAIGEMVRAMAHYWRRPLDTVGLLVQDLEDANAFGELNERYIEDIVRKVMRHVKTMSTSIDSFIECLRPSREKSVFDVRSAVSCVIKMMASQMDFYNITACVECFCGNKCAGTGEESCCLEGRTQIYGYYSEFKQVVFSVITNSIEAVSFRREKRTLMEEDEGFVFIKIRWEDGFVIVTFEDNGGGLDEKAIPRIFEPYYSSKKEGSGLGLYMAKNFVENNMGGSLSIENFNEGCLLTVKVPTAEKLPEVLKNI